MSIQEQKCIMPLVISESEWGRIKEWVGREGREDPEAKRRREYVQQLDATSREMTKTWPNSLENVNRRNEELRRERTEAAESANARFYSKYLKRKKQEQERLMTSARHVIFKNKDAPKLMLSAVIATRVLKEREEQVKFLAELKRQAAEKVKQDDLETIRKAKEWEQHLANQKKKRFEANKQHQKEILEQAHEISEKNRIEYEKELKMQLLDNKKADQQMEELKKFEEDFKVKKKAEILAGLQEASRQCNRRKAELEAIDSMDNRLIEVLNKSRARIENKRKQTELAERLAKLKVLEAISNKLSTGDAEREAREQSILEKARKEAENNAEERLARDAENRARIRKERNDIRDEWLRDEQRRLHEQRNMQAWDCMNRFKNEEIYEDYKKKVHQEERRKINQFRDDMLFQIKERNEREARERAELRHFYGAGALEKLRDADNKLLAHADQLLQEAHDLGCPDFPLRSCIDRYCNLYRLYPMPDLPASLKEHFQRYRPTDGTRPDPGYRAPAPVPEPGPAPDYKQHAGGATSDRNGLDEQDKASTSGGAKKEVVADYKRAGPANGLQKKPAQTELSLPQISVVPCRVASCACPLRK